MTAKELADRMLADDLEKELAKLDEECEAGIEDPVRMFEDTAKLVKLAIAALRKS